MTETQPTVVNVIWKIKLLSSGVTENVDHNQLTLAGKGTFHGMGVITASAIQMIKDVPVQCMTQRRKASDFVEKISILIVKYTGKSLNGLLK